jgi:hypothetical protein
MTQSPRAIVRGLKAFGQFLESERSRLAAAPIVLVTSQADSSEKGRTSKQVDDAVRHTSFLLQQKMGFRAVLSHPAAGYVFPTGSDVNKVAELAARVGASTIAAIGSGSAMDLAKAVCQASKLDELVLVPATFGASLAAASSHSLLLDPIEEALLVHPEQQTTATPRHATTIVTLEQKLFHSASMEESLYAAIAIALDHVYQGTQHEGIESLLEQAIQCLENKECAQHNTVVDIMYKAGESISYGLANENRSIPLALAASLIPNSFQQYSITTFLASLVPAYCQELERRGEIPELLGRIPVLSAPNTVTNDSYQTLLSHIRSNQALWNCRDCADDDFRSILSNHLLV